ncbi:hypothetical protein ACQKNX_07960 [Lysinibacillus sp. NPDC093712]|uniref:hypothetical protein n=1 Tax=Lysinibacillus sp. NPDC093712 TaxID=3390579 RepID=UPI003D05F862
MNSTERFKKVMDILKEFDLGNSPINHSFFDKLSEEEMDNQGLIKQTVNKLLSYQERVSLNTNTYPEYVMQNLRQRRGLDKYDTSLDDQLSKMSKDNAFKEVVNWNGLLGGYDYTIKSWVKDIYGVNLDDIK